MIDAAVVLVKEVGEASFCEHDTAASRGGGGGEGDAALRPRLETLFRRWDKDGSGYLDIDEMRRVLFHVEVHLERDELAAVVAKVKGMPVASLKESEYKISHDEFPAFFAALAEGDPQDLVDDTIRKLTMATLYMRWDTNGNGSLEIDELLAALLKVCVCKITASGARHQKHGAMRHGILGNDAWGLISGEWLTPPICMSDFA